MIEEKFKKQIDFINELEKLKLIYRKNRVIDNSRDENSAEHSWHIAIMSLIFKEYSLKKDLDIFKVIIMLLIHDIVEIDAGDTFLYDKDKNTQKRKKENDAAKRIFGLLPEDQKTEFLNLWKEYEEKKTDESLYASAIDALQPLINHYLSGKDNYNPFNMKKSEVIKKKQFIKDISTSLWELALEIIEKSVEKGLYYNY